MWCDGSFDYVSIDDIFIYVSMWASHALMDESVSVMRMFAIVSTNSVPILAF